MRKAFSVLLVVLLVPVLWAQMAAHSARSLLTDPALVKEIIRESGLYPEMQGLLVDQIAGGMQNLNVSVRLTRQEVSALVARVLPPERFQVHAETIIDGFYVWFVTGAPRPSIILDLSDLRATLPQAIGELAAVKIEALPVCTPAQAVALVASYSGGMPPCKSPDPSFNRMMVDLALPAGDVERIIPLRIDLAAELEARSGPEYWQRFDHEFSAVRFGIGAIPWGWGIVAFLLLLLGLLNLDRWYVPFGWTGGVLLFGGAVILFASLVGVNIILPFVTLLLEGSGPGETAALKVAGLALQRVAMALRNLSLLVTLAGLSGLIVAVAGRLLSRPPVPPEARAVSQTSQTR